MHPKDDPYGHFRTNIPDDVLRIRILIFPVESEKQNVP